MVSFQCHGCGDVVKKPKLDQHHGRCHAGFDCIDCSATFNTPAEFKSHTSCISEAEKYQKSLYKGSKNGREDSNGNVNGYHSARGWGGFQGRGRGNGRGGFQGRGPHLRLEGANGTPLGAPQRMSPVTTPIDNNPVASKTKSGTADTDPSAAAPIPTRDAAPASLPVINEENGSGLSSEKPKKDKKHKEKKSKSRSKESGREVKENESSVDYSASTLPPPSPGVIKQKNKKQRKEAGGEQTDGFAQAKTDIDELAKCGDLKEKKKKKKKSKDDQRMAEPKTDAPTQSEDKGQKGKGEIPTGETLRVKSDEQEKAVETKEKKKKKPKDISDTDGPKVDSGTRGENKESKEGKKREKKRKSEKPLEELIAPLGECATTLLQDEEGSKKELKKRKREGDGQEVADATVAKCKRKKTKKTPHSPDTPRDAEVKDSTISKESSSGKKRKREEKDDVQTNDIAVPGESKEKKKRKHKKDVVGTKD